MADPNPTEALALAHAPLKAAANTPKYKRLSDEQRRVISAMAKLGKTQVEIAQVVGCAQGNVSKWLAATTGTVDLASEYLAGQALRMARNVVERGSATDHVKVLQGVDVLKDKQVSGLTIQIGGGAGDVKVAVLVQGQAAK